MVLVLSVALGLSVVGMISVLGIKRYELATGKVFLRSARPQMRGFFHALTQWVVSVVPEKLSEYSGRTWSTLQTWLHRVIARCVIFVEYVLEQVLHIVREKTTPERGAGEVSAFLREVADHKKSLLKKSESRAIFEE